MPGLYWHIVVPDRYRAPLHVATRRRALAGETLRRVYLGQRMRERERHYCEQFGSLLRSRSISIGIEFRTRPTSGTLSQCARYPRKLPSANAVCVPTPDSSATRRLVAPFADCSSLVGINRPIFLITPLSAVAAKRYSSPVGIFLFRRRGSASSSDLGRSTPGGSPRELRFSLSHFLPRHTSSKPTGLATARTSCCGDARFVNVIPSSATVGGASRRTMNITTGLGSDAAFALLAGRASLCFPCSLSLHPLQPAGPCAGAPPALYGAPPVGRGDAYAEGPRPGARSLYPSPLVGRHGPLPTGGFLSASNVRPPDPLVGARRSGRSPG